MSALLYVWLSAVYGLFLTPRQHLICSSLLCNFFTSEDPKLPTFLFIPVECLQTIHLLHLSLPFFPGCGPISLSIHRLPFLKPYSLTHPCCTHQPYPSLMLWLLSSSVRYSLFHRPIMLSFPTLSYLLSSSATVLTLSLPLLSRLSGKRGQVNRLYVQDKRR